MGKQGLFMGFMSRKLLLLGGDGQEEKAGPYAVGEKLAQKKCLKMLNLSSKVMYN